MDRNDDISGRLTIHCSGMNGDRMRLERAQHDLRRLARNDLVLGRRLHDDRLRVVDRDAITDRRSSRRERRRYEEEEKGDHHLRRLRWRKKRSSSRSYGIAVLIASQSVPVVLK